MARRWSLRLALLPIVLLGVLIPCAASASGLPSDWQRGMNVTSWWHDEWERTSSDSSLAALKATGATDAEFVTTWYMPTPSASAVAASANATPSDAGLLRAMASARAMGLRVALKPHVDVSDGTFRGQIQPADPAAWFSTYQAMIEHYADLARQGGATTFVVGTELTSMSGYTADWRRIIADARARFSGTLTFAANQIDGAQAVGFWDALDAIGIDAYMPLSSNPNPSVDELTAAWWQRGYVGAIAALHDAYRKPVVFTEAGYQSRYGTTATPWWSTGQIATEPQRNAYEAAYRVWSQVPWVKGLYWWDWRAVGFNPSDGDFGPRGKPAEQTMYAWNTAPFVADPPPAITAPPAPSAQPVPVAVAVAPLPPALPRAFVRLHAKRSGRRTITLSGSVQRGCAAAVVVEIQSWRSSHRVWRTRLTLHPHTNGRGSFRLVSPRLHQGRYGAVASARSASCLPSQSSRVYFKS